MPIRVDDLTIPTVAAATTPTVAPQPAPSGLVEGSTEARILAAIYSGKPAVVVDAPPGAGKTQAVAGIAVHLAERGRLRVAAMCPTNGQARQLANRIAKAAPNTQVHLLVSQSRKTGMTAPAPNVSIVTSLTGTEARIVVATVAKTIYLDPGQWRADVLICEEAFQVCWSDFAACAPVADQYLLIGDPGQIAPVVTGETKRWESATIAPHRPAPEVLAAVHPANITRFGMPHTRRCGPETAALIQPAFYPHLPFTSARPPATFTPAGATEPAPEISAHVVDSAGPIADPALAAACADEALRLCNGTISDWQGTRPAKTNDVGIVVAHVGQATAVGAALAARNVPGYEKIKIDTADRWQGLERPCMVAWHPLAGQREVPEFNSAPGRLCVMLSRSTSALSVVCRADQRAVLNAHKPDDDAPNAAAWATQVAVLDALGVH